MVVSDDVPRPGRLPSQDLAYRVGSELVRAITDLQLVLYERQLITKKQLERLEKHGSGLSEARSWLGIRK